MAAILLASSTLLVGLYEAHTQISFEIPPLTTAYNTVIHDESMTDFNNDLYHIGILVNCRSLAN